MEKKGKKTIYIYRNMYRRKKYIYRNVSFSYIVQP